MASQKKRIRAGIIPYAYDDNSELVFLFGKEIYGKWSALAGTVKDNEDLAHAAVREFVEEIMGFYKEDDLLSYLNEDNKLVVIDDETISYYYLVPFVWDPNLPRYFANVTLFLLRCTGGKKNKWGVPTLGTCDDGLFEKSMIDWFPLSSLISMTYTETRRLFGRKATSMIQSLLRFVWASKERTR